MQQPQLVNDLNAIMPKQNQYRRECYERIADMNKENTKLLLTLLDFAQKLFVLASEGSPRELQRETQSRTGNPRGPQPSFEPDQR